MTEELTPSATSKAPDGNVTFLFCGLSISNLNGGAWRTAVLEDTGAPAHGASHGFRATAYHLDRTGHVFRAAPISIAEYSSDRFRYLRFEAAANAMTGGTHSASDAGNYHIQHMGDFAEFEAASNKRVKFQRSGHVRITRIDLNGGIGFAATLGTDADGNPVMYSFNGGSARFLGKCFGIEMKCSAGSSINVISNNDNSSSSIAESLFVPRDGGRLLVILDNDCDNPTTDVDFPFYYNDPSNGHHGIVDPRRKATLARPFPLKPMIGRVACNAMLATAIEGDFPG